MAGNELGVVLDRYLAACVQASLAKAPLPRWPFQDEASPELAHSDGDAFAEGLISSAEFHGVAGLLCQYDPLFPGWPAAVREAIMTLAQRAALEEALTRPAITAVIENLARLGIGSMIMKGAALAYLVYYPPYMRPRGDTDLLIREKDLVRVRQVISELGWYRPDNPQGIYFQEMWHYDCGAGVIHTLDLHWRTTDRPVLQQVLRDVDFWANPQPVPQLSLAAASPDRVSLVLHGAINALWHELRGFHVHGQRMTGRRRLIWAADIHQITRNFAVADWDGLISACSRLGAGAVVHRALCGAVADIGLAVPDQVMASLAAQGPDDPILDYITHVGMLGNFSADFRAAKNLRTRLHMIGTLAFAPRSHLLDKYPGASHWPTAALQLRRYSQGLGDLLAARAAKSGSAGRP